MPADAAINKIRRGLVRELSSRRFQDALKELDDKEYLKFCIDVMEFCLPKLQRTELTAEVTNKDTIVFEIAGQKIPFQSAN